MTYPKAALGALLFFFAACTPDPALRSATPGGAAAEAYELYQSGDPDAACASFLQQIRGGTTDPWSFHGAVVCATEIPTMRDAVLGVLAELEDSHLVLYTRGYLSYHDGDLATAEELLRRAVERVPDFSLAWNALGAVVNERGDAQAAASLIEHALELSPNLEMARKNLETAKLCIGVFDRLLALLEELPTHWDNLPEARIPTSGRRPKEILLASSDEDLSTVLEFISSLAHAPLSKRATMIERYLEEREPTEVDLWWPGKATDNTKIRSLNKAALFAEAWLQWTAALGRRDVLFSAGAMAVDIVQLRVNPKDLAATLRLWVELPRTEGTEEGQAQISEQYAKTLFFLGKNEEALEAYRKARNLFQTAASQLGEANALNGEADVLFFLGKNEEAFEAYRKARTLFHAVGEQLGEGNTFYGEANVLFLFGKIERALEAYRKARTIYHTVGDEIGEGNTFQGEADVFFRLGDHKGALGLYRKARALFHAVGEKIGEARTFRGEASSLLSMGENEGIAEVYRKAHTLSQAAGDKLGDGNTFLGEADVLLLSGKNEEALEAYRKARALFHAVGDNLGEGNTFYGEANVLFLLGENEEATINAARSGDLFRRVAATLNRINALLLEGRARRRLKDTAAVVRLTQEAIRLHSIYRKGFVAEDHRTRFDERIFVAYDLLIPILGHRSESLDSALSRSEEARSRVLLDVLTTGHLGGDDAPPNLQQENKRLRAELAHVGSKLHREMDPARHRELLVKRQVLDAELQSNLYRRISAEHRDLEFGKPLDANAIRGLAGKVGPIVLFYVSDVELVTFLVPPPPGEVRIRIIDLGRKEIGERVETFLFDLSNPLVERRARDQAADFWRQLFAPFAEYLPASGPLTLVPHGPLHELPFEALVVDPKTGQRLFQRWDVTVTPSVSALALARRHHQTPSIDDNLVAFAAGVGLNLPEIEIRQVAGFFPASQQSTFGPTEAEFHHYEELASQARHLLIATRGVHVEGSRRGTYLEIQPTEDVHDERLSAAEIAGIPIQTELVTLAACDTASGTALLSDERLTLVRSFLIAGATSILATRWRIPEDQSATRFLQDFYRAYRRGGPQGRGMRKDEALTEARRLSIERGDPAQEWAAWVLVGDAR